jgi:hypothetical protein
MGVGMQIVFFGFAGSGELEGEAGAQLVRLERYSKLLTGCHLAIEATPARSGPRMYDVRLDLRLRDRGLLPLAHCPGQDPLALIRQAFDRADETLNRIAVERLHRSR